MKLNTTSWHYKLIDWFAQYPASHYNSICSYGRMLIASVLSLVFLTTTIVSAAALLISTLFMPLSIAAAIMVSLLWVAIGFMIIFIIREESFFSEGVMGTVLYEEKEYVETEPSVIWEFIKAQHDKACIKINFVGD